MEKADLLLYNGTCLTMDPLLPEATALAIKKDKIIWIGDQRDASSWISPNTQRINLKGAFAYPGFIDTHAHLLYTGIAKSCLQLHQCSKEDVIAKITEEVCKREKDQWIVGVGWDESEWVVPTLPHAFDLDRIAPYHPIMLERIDTHLIWVNSHALRICGITGDTPDPIGGKIIKDHLGHPTGILLDTAMQLVKDKLPILDWNAHIRLIKEVLKEYIKHGVTMVHDASITPSTLEVFKYLDKIKALDARVYMMGAIKNKQDTLFLLQGLQHYSSFLELRCLKIWIDGALGSRGAALLDPYQDDPNNKGLLLWKEEDLLSILQIANSQGFQVAVHAIGDKANRFTLDMYEKIGVESKRWRIEHAQLLAESDIKRFAKLKVIAAMQPSHAIADMPWFEERVGDVRTKLGGFVWRSLIDAGVRIVGGSDSPVADLNPLLGIYAAVTRQTHRGYPEKGWYFNQRMTQEEALRSYTIDAAYASFREHELGSLSQGKLADLVILPENLLTCNPSAMIEMPILYTLVNGKIAFQSNHT